MELKGRTALITGGGTGFGLAIARALVSNGVTVMIAGRRKKLLDDAAAELREMGGVCHVATADVSKADECSRLATTAIETLGAVDILVNNAGMPAHAKTFHEHTEAEWYAVMDTNLKSAFFLSSALLPHMSERKTGYIIMMSSISGVRYYPKQVLYGLSKHGMNALAEFIMAEYAEHNIHALCICPGIALTEMGLIHSPVHVDALITPEDIAGWVVHAVSQHDRVRVPNPIVLATSRNPWTGVFR